MDDVGEENGKVVVATTMVAYALSSMVTGIAFFLLGYFKVIQTSVRINLQQAWKTGGFLP